MTPSLRLAARRAAPILAVAGLAACAAPTVMNAQWVDPKVAGKPPMRSILVLGITKDPSNRRVFEDRMAAQLVARGIKAVPSYDFAPDAGAMEQVRLEQVVKESGVAGVLLTRVVNVSEQVHVTPAMVMGPPMGYGFGGFYGYYGGMWAASMYTPPTVYTTKHVAADTRLFETAHFSVVWSASTTTTPSGGSVASLFDQFSRLIAGALVKDGLI
ncbi:MAG TPA: hypothetical protein PKB14_04240 [Rubrivivax sp.]|nr:hypothetical protein [Rubrivivax sp.]